ncbi:GNAT family N-acetyltransferase [Streptococcus gallinaceus]|uniref:Ribosomal protein S18 acetylase RimI-like enzyme n=1 Tax=Streptococcus gallinaceus TaxID=165758 RepID=A0ABV2JM94_9STRE
MRIREITDSDLEAYVHLQNTGWTVQTSPVYQRIFTVEQVSKSLKNQGNTLVAEIDNHMVGALDYSPFYPFESGKHVLTFGILVAEPSRVQGIGRALMESFLTRATELGYKKIAMHVMGTSPEAVAFYENYGFQVEACLTDHFYLEGQYVDGLIFGKWIGEDHAR